MGISKTERKEIVELFEKVQRVPYFLLRHRDSRKLFSLNKGCCAEKVVWLGNKFKSLGLPVRYFLIEFKWEDLPIPDEVLDLKGKGPDYHLAMKTKIDGNWIWIDPTWDPALGKLGFPITEGWDGKNDTLLAVKPLKIKGFEPEDPSDTDLDGEFWNAFNKYLENARQTP